MKTVELICSYCNKTFTRLAKVYKQDLKKGKKDFFCSIECFRPSQIVPCGNCGKNFRCSPNRIRRSKTGLNYCSRKCATIANNHFKSGENHPNWNGGIGTYRSRKKIEECESCGERRYWLLMVHHRDSNRHNNVDENLAVLCYNCHAEQHLVISDGLFCVNWNAQTTDEIKSLVLAERH